MKSNTKALLAIVIPLGSLFSRGSKGSQNINKELKGAFQQEFIAGIGSANKNINQLFLSAEPTLVSDENLVAILLFGITGNKNPTVVANEILQSVDNKLGQLIGGEFLASSYSESSKAKMIAAAELTRRANYRGFLEGHSEPVTNPNEMVRAFMSSGLSTGMEETLSALYFNNRMEIIASGILSKGSHRMTLADHSYIIGQVLRKNATRFAIAHQHPSGSIEFSPEDKSITLKLQEAAKCAGVTLIDSFVIGKQPVFHGLPGYTSAATGQGWF